MTWTGSWPGRDLRLLAFVLRPANSGVIWSASLNESACDAGIRTGRMDGVLHRDVAAAAAHAGGGFYWLALAAMLGIVGAVYNTWVLLVEIVR
jgi:hypothetical protein